MREEKKSFLVRLHFSLLIINFTRPFSFLKFRNMKKCLLILKIYKQSKKKKKNCFQFIERVQNDCLKRKNYVHCSMFIHFKNPDPYQLFLFTSERGVNWEDNRTKFMKKQGVARIIDADEKSLNYLQHSSFFFWNGFIMQFCSQNDKSKSN